MRGSACLLICVARTSRSHSMALATTTPRWRRLDCSRPALASARESSPSTPAPCYRTLTWRVPLPSRMRSRPRSRRSLAARAHIQLDQLLGCLLCEWPLERLRHQFANNGLRAFAGAHLRVPQQRVSLLGIQPLDLQCHRRESQIERARLCASVRAYLVQRGI